MYKKISYKILSVFVILSIIISVSIYSYADEVTDNQTLPDPVKIVDFSYDYDELEEQDVGFAVVENDASPILIEDKEMGQVLQLKKAIIADEEALSSVESKDTQYSQINISNPYADLDYLVECEPYEEVELIEYQDYFTRMGLNYGNGYITQPYWKTGITISYWIKSPGSVNSNVVGFFGSRFQIDSLDYSNYLKTVKFDLEYASMTDDERNMLDLGPSGVLPDSDFYFDYLYEDNGEITTYKGKPVYISPEKMGKYYWMNKFYEPGYVVDDASYVNPRYNSVSYEMYCEAPYLGESADDHDPGNSILRYGWLESEMFLDATSSFYFTNEGPPTTQLNPNHATSYNTKRLFTSSDNFNINSWKSADTYEEAVEKGTIAPSPVSIPDKWHNVTVIIQNDWVKYYLDGAEIDIEDNYSAFGFDSLDNTHISASPWQCFNRGTGARYGYGGNGSHGSRAVNTMSVNNVAPTIMEFLTQDSTKLCIGGGNMHGDGYLMFAETDEILLKNVVFYDCMLTEEQITELAEKPFIYDKDDSKNTSNGATAAPENILGDVDIDEDIDANDALQVLKYVAKLEDLTDVQKSVGDVDGDKKISPKDALYILKKAAVIIDSFPTMQ